MWRVHIIRSQQHDDDETVEGAFLFSPFFFLLSCFNKQSHLVKCSITAVCCWSFLQLFPPSVVVKNIFFGEGEPAREDETVIWNTDTSHMNAQSEVCEEEEGEWTEETLTKQKWLHDWYSEDVFGFLNVWAKTRSLRFLEHGSGVESRLPSFPLPPYPPSPPPPNVHAFLSGCMLLLYSTEIQTPAQQTWKDCLPFADVQTLDKNTLYPNKHSYQLLCHPLLKKK